jgi:hypothetical protein
MTKSLTLGGALLALATLASPANAGMLGGTTSPTTMSRGADSHISSATSSLGSRHTFADARGSALSGRSFSAEGLEHTKGTHWKKPIDSDGGGADDPPKKSPKDPLQTGDQSGQPTRASHLPFYPDGYRHHPQGGGSSQPPLACRGRVGGC